MPTLTLPVAPPREKRRDSEPIITGEEFAALTELGHAELIDGRIARMPPPKNRHGRCVSRLTFLLMAFLAERKLGLVLSGESGVYIRRHPDTVRGMDVAYISNERWAPQGDKDGYAELFE
jgi:Uma2 family endonuclease